MEHPRPMLPSQRFSSSPVYGYDHTGRHSGSSRPPLRESTGNAQHLGTLLSSSNPIPSAAAAVQATCRPPSLGLFSPSLPPSIPTPVVPSQAGAIYRNGTLGSIRTRPDHPRLSRRTRPDINPIYYAPEFRPYRDKQDQKDPNEKQIWPRVLEDAFLDALLIIPHMGRKKYSMQGKQYGRNMLISEYLWIAYRCSLQGRTAEERKRKQVSSHIQVVKKMFEKHRCYHFFFVKDADKSEARLKESSAEIASFKDNPVLIALSENRLPDVRPNYEYFSQILARDSMVVMRPKTCWIFVSSSEVTMDEAGNAYDHSGKVLELDAYPHLEKNLQKESDGALARCLSNNGVLLHEYNRELTQKESAAMSELAQEWEVNFPELHHSLEAATAENRWLDMLEMTVTLELHPRSNFPRGSDLNGFVELSIAQPQLQNHRWKCVTRLQRPEDLCRGSDEPPIVEQTSTVGIQYTHRQGCPGQNGRAGIDCECRNRSRQDVRVPFPAAEWASILSSCAAYLQETQDIKVKTEGGSSEDIKAADQAALDSERQASDLIQQIAMSQELWSSPPGELSNDRRKWTRRGVVLWKFRTINAFDDKMNPIYEKPSITKGRKPSDVDGDESPSSSGRRSSRPKRVYHPPGTTWRFLTAIDPISPEHQQNVCINPAINTNHHSNMPNRDLVMAPAPHYSHHLTAAMNENLNAAWDSVSLPGQLPSLASAHSMVLMDGFSHGLATPPPTASLQSPYTTSFETHHDPGSQHQQSHQQAHIDFLHTACTTSIDSQSTLVTDGGADPFLSVTTGMNVSSALNGVGGYDEADFAGASQNWDSTTAASSFNSLEPWNHWESSNDAPSGNSNAKVGGASQLWQTENHRSASANHNNIWSAPGSGDGGRDGSHMWNQQPWNHGVPSSNGGRGAPGWSDLDHSQLPHPSSHHQQKVLPSLDQISPLKGITGRKRARSNSLDMENRENYPAATIQKLTHHAHGVPGIDDNGHAQHRWD